MVSVYHEGELAVQERAGVRGQAARVGGIVRSAIPPAAREFLEEQRMAVVASVEKRTGRVWASLLCGEPSFMRATTERTLRIETRPAAGDPLAENLSEGADVGLIAIEFDTRRRMRVNGKVARLGERLVEIHTEHVYSNCPKYIQARTLTTEANRAVDRDESETAHETRSARRGETISLAQRQLIELSDTFFIASFHAEGGADASHRGGQPGFVRVLDGKRLAWPDYAGNNMFNTLGNLAADPRVGLLFIDFERGNTLQLTGRALINWDEARRAEFAGAERVLEFELDETLELEGACPWRWEFLDYSPFNPAPFESPDASRR